MFPLGAYTSATLKIASLLSSPTIKVFGVLLYGMLFVLWLITGVRTVIHLTSSLNGGSHSSARSPVIHRAGWRHRARSGYLGRNKNGV
nr:hypothetical protein [Pyrococcus kukulkanii]